MQTIIDENRDNRELSRYLNDILIETIYRAIYREAIVLTVAIYRWALRELSFALSDISFSLSDISQ